MLLASLGSAAAVQASPNRGIEARTLAQSVVDGQQYVTRELTIAPGGSTGWHWHEVQVFGLVRAGTLTHDKADCSSDGVYPAGAPITEGSGPGEVHIGRNLGPDPVVLWVLYIGPADAPLATDAPNPGCPFE